MGFLPSRTPRAFARSRPSVVRALISSLSNSARPPSTVRIKRPVGVAVSGKAHNRSAYERGVAYVDLNNFPRASYFRGNPANSAKGCPQHRLISEVTRTREVRSLAIPLTAAEQCEARDRQICALAAQGLGFKAIARRFGLSGQRVRQIVWAAQRKIAALDCDPALMR